MICPASKDRCGSSPKSHQQRRSRSPRAAAAPRMSAAALASSVVQQTRKSLTQRVQVNVEDLKREIGNLLGVVGDVFDQARNETGMSLEEVELSIEVSSEGQISILGSGGKISGSGGIKLSFKRQRPTS